MECLGCVQNIVKWWSKDFESLPYQQKITNTFALKIFKWSKIHAIV